MTAPTIDQKIEWAEIELIDFTLALKRPAGWTLFSENEKSRIGPQSGGLSIELIQSESSGESLLTHIEEAAGPNSERRLLLASRGRPWGELVQTESQYIALLHTTQPDHFVRLSGPVDPVVEQVILSARPLDPLPIADIAIEMVEARRNGSDRWSFSVRIRHPDLGWDDYADGWQIVDPNGRVIATRILLHPHENEQPFTRSLAGVEIEHGVGTVWVVAHESVEGYGMPLLLDLSSSTEGEPIRVEP